MLNARSDDPGGTVASPVFSTGKEFQPGATFTQQGEVATAEQLQQQFDQPSAIGLDSERMTYNGTIGKTAGIALLTFVAAIPGYTNPNTVGLVVGALVAFVLSMVIIFQKRSNPVLIALYGIAEGYFLGAITIWIEQYYDVPGAGLQALVATGLTFAVCLTLYRTGVVRYTSKMRKFLLIGGIGYLLFGLVNIGYMLFSSSTSGFGLREDLQIGGIPLGVVIGAFAVLLACISLIADFDYIDNGVKGGAPKHVEWKAAFGLILTLVWLYIEFLRIIAIVMGRR
jgi:uncharacterized YccA/Bax inhibitor family protein